MLTSNGRPHTARSIGRRREDHIRARLAALVHSSADAIIGATLDGIITDWNPAAERLFGYAAEEAIGQPLTLLIPPDQLADAKSMLDRVCRGASVDGVETVRLSKDGRRSAVALTASPVWNEDGELIATSAIIRDISDRKAAERALAASEAQYRALVDQMPAVIYTEQADAAHTLIYISPYVTTLLGYAPEAFFADPGLWTRRIHPDDKARVQAASARMNATGEPLRDEYRLLARDGRIVWVSDATMPVRDAAGQLLFWQGVALDVTAHKVAEEALAASEERFRTAFDNAPIGMALVDPDGALLEVNHALCAMLGYAEHVLRTKYFQEITHPQDLAQNHPTTQHVLAGKIAVYELEKRYLHQDGHAVWAALSTSPVRDETGAPRYFISQIQDITERRRLTEELRASEEKFRTLVDLLPALVYVVVADDARTPLYFSPYLEELTGYRPEEALGRTHPWLETVHPDDRDRVAAEDARAMASGEPLRIEYRYRRKDGSYVWVLEESILIRDERGAIVALHGVLMDISDRVAAEEAQARLAAIVASAEDAIISRTLDGTITSWNGGAERLYGYRAEEMLGRSLAILMPDGDAADLLVSPEALGAQPTQFEARRQRRDGTIVDVAISLFPIRDTHGCMIGVSSIARDITARKQADAALRDALEAAHAATRAKSLFLAMMSHELRTPLQAVLGYADLLLADSVRSFSPEQAEDIRAIHRGAARMVALIEQLLDLSRMEAGRLQLETKPVNLTEILEHVRQDIAPQVIAKALALIISLPASLPFVLGDADRLRQILLNLVGNAVKFTEQGVVHVTARATEDGVTVVVRDTGIGISEVALPFIFEEFRQVDGSITRRFGGAGLGLAIAKRLAEHMGGGISVESEVGVGSTFSLWLPVVPPTRPPSHRR